MPKERIFVCLDPTRKAQPLSKHWKAEIDTYVSDDLFRSKQLILSRGNALIKTDHFMYVARAVKNQMGKIEIYGAHLLKGFSDFLKIQVPVENLRTSAFSILDTSEESVFLYVKHAESNSQLGNLYISDSSGL